MKSTTTSSSAKLFHNEKDYCISTKPNPKNKHTTLVAVYEKKLDEFLQAPLSSTSQDDGFNYDKEYLDSFKTFLVREKAKKRLEGISNHIKTL